MGYKDFQVGEVLTSQDVDNFLMRQTVMRFADSVTRDTALSAVLAEGMICYLDDTDEVLKYDGSSWIDISGDITGVTAGTALTGGGTSGNVTLDVDETALTIAQSQVTDLTADLAGKQDDVITTQGDLVIGDASGNPVRLPVGSADQVLTSDGTTVSFQDAGGGGAELIGSTTTGSGVSTVSFTNIPQTFNGLRLLISDCGQQASDQNNIVEVKFLENGSAFNFRRADLGGSSAGLQSNLRLVNQSSTTKWGGFVELWNYSTQYGHGFSVNHYEDPFNNNKATHYSFQFELDTLDEIQIVAGFNNFASGSTFELYGIS